MADLNIGKAPPNSAILPFYTTGAFAFWILCLLLFIASDSLTTFYFNPHLLTIVHTAALGWGTMVIFGAAHQLLPVVCERDLYSNKLATWCWYTLSLGVLMLTISFWNFNIGWMMISGGALIVLSALAFFINSIMTSKGSGHYTPAKLFIVSASFWLLFTTTLGLLLAINLAHPFFNKSHLEILKLHAHAGLAGWFLQLITGISSKLVPMFLLGKTTKDKLLHYTFIFQNIGLLLFLTDGYFFGINSYRALLYGALVLIGVIFWLIYLQDAYKHRLRKKIEIQMKHTFISFIFLLIAFIFIPIIILSKDYHFALLYGTFIFMGWISGIILGKTFKTLPFIIWNEHYKKLSGKKVVPLPKDLYNEKIIKWQFVLFLFAMVTLAFGIILKQNYVIKVSSIIWLSVATIYLYNVIKMLTHKPNLQ